MRFHILLIDLVTRLASQNHKFTDYILTTQVNSRIRFAVSGRLGHLHRFAERHLGTDGIEYIVKRSAQHSLYAQNLVSAVAQVVYSAYDGQSCPHIGFKEELDTTFVRNFLQFVIILEITACRNLVGCHHMDIMIEEVLVKPCHLGTGSTIHKHAVKDVHANHLVMQTLYVAVLRIGQELTEIAQFQSVTRKDRLVTAGNSHHIQFQTHLVHQFLPLLGNLFDKASANGTHSGNEQIEHLILTQKKTVMDDIKRFAEIARIHHK